MTICSSRIDSAQRDIAPAHALRCIGYAELFEHAHKGELDDLSVLARADDDLLERLLERHPCLRRGRAAQRQLVDDLWDAVDDDDVMVEMAAGRFMVDKAPFALLVEAGVLDGEQRGHEHVDKVLEHLRRFIAAKVIQICVDVVEHPVKSLCELLLREVFDGRQPQRQRLQALKDRRWFQDKSHARLAAVSAPHRETPLAALTRPVLRDAGQICVRNVAPLILVEVAHHRVEHVRPPVEALRQMLDALAPVIRTVDRLVEQLDAVVNLAVVIHAGCRAHP